MATALAMGDNEGNMFEALWKYSEAGIKRRKYDEVYNMLITGVSEEKYGADAAMIARVYVNMIFNEREKGRTVGGDDNGKLWYGDGNRWYHRKLNRSWICDEWATLARPALDKSTSKTKYFKNEPGYTPPKPSDDGHMWNVITRRNEDGSFSKFKLDPWHTAYPDIYPNYE